MAEKKKILLINGHPDGLHSHYCQALLEAYREGAEASTHAVKKVTVASLEFPLIRSQQAFESGDVPDDIQQSQQLIRWADHLVIIFPLWLGTTPAYFKAYIEQVFRYGFGMSASEANQQSMPKKLLKGKTARIVVTMGMPAFLYRSWFGGHGVKYLRSSVLKLTGISPVKIDLIGMIDNKSEAGRQRQLKRMHALGRRSA